MSTIKVTNLRHESASSSNITLDSSNNVTTANNFTAGGTIGCTGNLTITSGNLVVGSGNGIDFSATTGTGTSELFDDYEEGTWTPYVQGVLAYTNQVGRYTKVGRLVYVTMWATGMNVGFSLDCQVTSLPFTVRETYSAVTITYNTYGLNGGGNGYFDLNTSGFYILTENSNVPQTSNTGTGRILMASGCYLTDT